MSYREAEKAQEYARQAFALEEDETREFITAKDRPAEIGILSRMTDLLAGNRRS